jgi:hypothetical protein
LPPSSRPTAGEGARRGAFDGLSAADRSGEVDEAEGAGGDQAFGAVVVEDDVLEDVGGHAALVERVGQPFAHEDRLARVLQHDRVPGDEGRDDGVDRGEVGVVPGCDDEDEAVGFALDPAVEAVRVLGDHRGQRLGGDPGHVGGAFVHAAEFAAEAGGAAHLPGEFLDDAVFLVPKRGDPRRHLRDALLERQRGPCGLRGLRAGDGGGCRLGRECRAFGVDPPVDGRDALDHLGHCRSSGPFGPCHARSKPRFTSQSVTTRSDSDISQSAARW